MFRHITAVNQPQLDLLTGVSEQGGDTLSRLVVEDGDVFIGAAGGKERP